LYTLVFLALIITYIGFREAFEFINSKQVYKHLREETLFFSNGDNSVPLILKVILSQFIFNIIYTKLQKKSFLKKPTLSIFLFLRIFLIVFFKISWAFVL
jgi:hypothetical protein